VRLAEKLAAIAPAGLNHVLFQCSGSEANDAAIKLVWDYNNIRGMPAKKKPIGRVRGYHGNTVATASISGQPHMQADFDLPLGDRFLHPSNPNYYRFGEEGESEEQFSARMAAELEALIAREGAETIAAIFAEPVQGEGGAITPPRGYFDLIQPIQRRHDILLVADEVICGFGRAGNLWGSQTYGMRPGMLVCAKRLTASYQPLSALLISDPIHAALMEESRKHGSFGHGFTYGGHPVACAVGLETLAIYEERDILGHVRAVAPAFLAGLGAMRDHPLVGDVRGIGLIAGVEPVADRASKAPFPAAAKVGLPVQERCQAAGLIVRAIGERIAFTPPLIITADETREDVRAVRGGAGCGLGGAAGEGAGGEVVKQLYDHCGHGELGDARIAAARCEGRLLRRGGEGDAGRAERGHAAWGAGGGGARLCRVAAADRGAALLRRSAARFPRRGRGCPRPGAGARPGAVSRGFLLDTNVISATAPDRREVPDAAKQAARVWILAHQAELFLPVIAVAEVAAGIGLREASGATRHAADLAAWLRAVLAAYPERVLGFDSWAALQARELARTARAAGVEPGFADLTLACIARAHGLVLATRNARHFTPMGLDVVDPFQLR
jgi:4-aminobutyrate--pyruvate transaminase